MSAKWSSRISCRCTLGLVNLFRSFADDLLRAENARLKIEVERLSVENRIGRIERETLLAVVERDHQRIKRETVDFIGPVPPKNPE